MNELYELIEKKIKESGYPRQISVIRLTEKKMGHICCFRNLRRM